MEKESLLKENQELENEITQLESELEELEVKDDRKNSKIFGLPSSMLENVLIEVLTPHASKIISGLTGKKESAI